MAKHRTSFRFSDNRVVKVKFTEPKTLWESSDGDSKHTRSTCRLPALPLLVGLTSLFVWFTTSTRWAGPGAK